MSIETTIYGALSGFAGGRVFPDVAPAGTARPHITWQQFGGKVINPIANESPGKRNANIQINVWADTRLGAVNLALDVEDAIRAIGGRPLAASISLYEPDTKLYGTIQEFSIWGDR